jgi:TolA-binding protein
VQDNLRNSMAEQQQRTAAPLANLGNKLNQVSEDVGTIKENVGDLESRMTKLDGKLSDISTAVRTLSTPPPAPPNANGSSGTQPQQSAAAADALFESARRDYSSGNDTLAMQEFEDYLKNYPTFVEHAPEAWYDIGYIYYRSKPPQFDDAIQAFDTVVERYPENPKTPEAMYMKGAALMNAKRNSEAIAEFRNVVKTYPNHPNAAKAQAHLRELSAGTSPAKGKKK